jgi:cellulose synthase/poly-beta-1,6-N-acetylglucosamine synthase-like glycosyltransferase
MEVILIIIYIGIYLGLIATTFYILSFFEDKKKKHLFYEEEELPKVSVLIPAWNEEKSIAKTIESILNSNYPDFEVIIIDDGSKDKTLQIAKSYETEQLKVFTKPNGGKGNALNFGIEKAKGEIIFTMDADTHVEPHTMKNMVKYFKQENVMSVTPAMLVYKPKSILQRIQAIEYFLGLFLRRAFAALDAIFITPGAFSAYRKKFFDKYGGYDEGNITEDLEMALRIQSKGYTTKNCSYAPAHTVVPKKFKPVLIQRRRWYYGLIKNTIKYKKILSKNYGDLGLFVYPNAIMGIILAVIVTITFSFKTLISIKKEILFLKSINFNFSGILDINLYVVERFLFLLFSNPVILFILVFLILCGFYLYYASKKIGRQKGLLINVPLFFMFFSVLFAFWWIVSIIYSIFVKEIKWR